MNFKKLLVCVGLVGVSAVGVGCGGDKPPAMTPDAGPPSTHFYVVNVLSIGDLEEDGTTAGFNIDGDNVVECNGLVAGTDVELNGAAPDNGTGIDNALGPTLAGLVGNSVQDNLDDASLLLLVEVSDINNFTNDSSVGVTFYLGELPAGTTVPMLGADMHLAPNQTFDLSDQSFLDGIAGTMPRITFGAASIVSGRLRAGPSNFPLSLNIAGADLALTIRSAQLRFDISEAGISQGRLGGSLNTEEVVAAIASIMPPPIPPDSARDILSGIADIDESMPPSPASCEAGSITLKLDGVHAIRGMVVTPAP